MSKSYTLADADHFQGDKMKSLMTDVMHLKRVDVESSQEFARRIDLTTNNMKDNLRGLFHNPTFRVTVNFDNPAGCARIRVAVINGEPLTDWETK